MRVWSITDTGLVRKENQDAYFVEEMADEWQRSRPVQAFELRNGINADDDVEIIADTGLRQMLFNVLDNALEASPGWLALEAVVADDELHLVAIDRGPGFLPAMLERIGTPYQSSKAAPGRGLGLFLSVNVARALGGRVQACNAGDGARVTIALPLQALAIDTGSDDD